MSSAACGGRRPSSPAMLCVEDKVSSTEMQGIGSILCFSSEEKRPKRTASLRRTFSADMSSKIWLAQHGPCPLKKIASSEEFSTMSANKGSSSSSSSLSSSSEEKEEKEERPAQFDIWSTIQSQKEKELSKVEISSPYIHPLVKQSSSSLSEKSLEICTESLGSETGSDGFSEGDCSYSPSESSDEGEEEEAEEDEEARVENKELGVVNYHTSIGRKSPLRAFPPPLTSISRRDGPCLHVRPHRKDGRLVLEAVPVPSHNYLHAQRQGGRLLLSFVNATDTERRSNIFDDDEDEEEMEEEIEEAIEEAEEFEEATEEAGEVEEEIEEVTEEIEVAERRIVLEMKVSEELPNGIMKVHRSALVINKFMGGTVLNNRNPWTEKLGKLVNLQQPPPAAPQLHDSNGLARLLPPAFNTYECCWKSGPTTQRTLANKLLLKKLKDDRPIRGNEADKSTVSVPMRRCNEPRKPLWIWEPYCIATT